MKVEEINTADQFFVAVWNYYTADKSEAKKNQIRPIAESDTTILRSWIKNKNYHYPDKIDWAAAFSSLVMVRPRKFDFPCAADMQPHINGARNVDNSQTYNTLTGGDIDGHWVCRKCRGKGGELSTIIKNGITIEGCIPCDWCELSGYVTKERRFELNSAGHDNGAGNVFIRNEPWDETLESMRDIHPEAYALFMAARKSRGIPKRRRNNV